MCTHSAVNPIGANHCVGGGDGTVFEMDGNWTIAFFLQRSDAFVEVCALRRNDLDKLVQEVRPMHALHAFVSALSVDELALVLALALSEKRKLAQVSIFKRRNSTHHNPIGNSLSMFRPEVASGMFVEGSFSFGCYELQCPLGIESNADTSTNLTERWRTLVDLHVNMRVFEQSDGSADAADTPTEDRDTEKLRRYFRA